MLILAKQFDMIYTFSDFKLNVIKLNNGILLCDLNDKAKKYYPGNYNIHDKDLIEYLFIDYSMTFRDFIEKS